MTIFELKEKMLSFHLKEFSSASLELLSTISRNSELKELLNSILDNSEELERISLNSFFHNLGFIRINLIDWELSKCMIKVHIWNLQNNQSQTEEFENISIHNHLYDFRSTIILGELFFKIFRESASGLEYHKYENPLSSDKYIFNYEGQRRLEELLDVNLAQSSHYYINNETIHLAYAKKNVCTATICVQSEPRKDNTYIYSQNALKDLSKTQRYSSSTLRKVISDFLKLI